MYHMIFVDKPVGSEVGIRHAILLQERQKYSKLWSRKRIDEFWVVIDFYKRLL